MIETDEGRWNPAALRRAKSVTTVEWYGLPGRAYSLMLGNACIALIRRRGPARPVDPAAWQLTMQGYEWRVTPDMRLSTVIPDLKFTPVKGFANSREAKAEAVRVMRSAEAVA